MCALFTFWFGLYLVDCKSAPKFYGIAYNFLVLHTHTQTHTHLMLWPFVSFVQILNANARNVEIENTSFFLRLYSKKETDADRQTHKYAQSKWWREREIAIEILYNPKIRVIEFSSHVHYLLQLFVWLVDFMSNYCQWMVWLSSVLNVCLFVCFCIIRGQ